MEETKVVRENGIRYYCFDFVDEKRLEEERRFKASDFRTAFQMARNEAKYRTDKTGILTWFFPIFNN